MELDTFNDGIFDDSIFVEQNFCWQELSLIESYVDKNYHEEATDRHH